MAESQLIRTCEGLVRALGLLAEAFPQPGGRPIHLTVSADGIELAVDVDVETADFLACRAAESADRGQARRRRNTLRLVTS